MTSLGVVISDVVADFELGFGQPGEAAAIEQLGLETAPKRFGVRVVVAVAAPAHAYGKQGTGSSEQRQYHQGPALRVG